MSDSRIRLDGLAGTPSETPPDGSFDLYFDRNGRALRVDKDGAVTPVATLEGDPVPADEQAVNPAGEAGRYYLFSKRILGVLEMFLVREDGIPIQVTSAGALAAGSGPSLNWKADEPGDPYVAGDTAEAEHNSIVYFDLSDPDTATLNLPDITPASGGQKVRVRNIVDKKKNTPGSVLLQPGDDDQVENAGAGVLAVVLENAWTYVDLESDGVGTWRMVAFSGNLLVGPYVP